MLRHDHVVNLRMSLFFEYGGESERELSEVCEYIPNELFEICAYGSLMRASLRGELMASEHGRVTRERDQDS